MSESTEPTVYEGELIEASDEEPTPPPLPEHFRQKRRVQAAESLTVENIDLFLVNLELTGLTKRSAEAAGLSYQRIKALTKTEPVFKQLFEESMTAYRETLEAECHRRAVEGWEEPVFSHKTGEKMGTIKKYDPRLLELMLKRHMPEYREKFEGEIKVTGGVLVAPVSPATVEDWVAKHAGEKLALLSGETSGKLPAAEVNQA